MTAQQLVDMLSTAIADGDITPDTPVTISVGQYMYTTPIQIVAYPTYRVDISDGMMYS